MKMTKKEEETLRKRSDELYEEAWRLHHLTVAFCAEKLGLLLDDKFFYNENNRLDCKEVEKWGRAMLKNVEKFEKDVLEKQKRKFQKSFARLKDWAAKRKGK